MDAHIYVLFFDPPHILPGDPTPTYVLFVFEDPPTYFDFHIYYFSILPSSGSQMKKNPKNMPGGSVEKMCRDFVIADSLHILKKVF